MASAPATNQVQIPSHVPPELVQPIQITEGEEWLAGPHLYMQKLHATRPPIFYSYTEHVSPAWLLTKYEDCFFVLRHPEIFTTKGATPFPRDPNDYFPMLPLESDPPDHKKYRAVLDPMFSPQAIAKLEDWVRKLANDLIDTFIDKGECEFTKEFGRPLPVSVFLHLVGLPQDMRDTFVRWAMGLLHSMDRDVAQQCMNETVAYLKEAIKEKIAKPDEGAISAIVHAKPNGVPMKQSEVFGFVFFLWIAGLDTVFATLNNIFLWLAQNPARRREIIDNPANITNTVEELLRYYSVTFSGRTLTRDYEMRGVKFKAGDKVTCILPAANYDPEIFVNPNEVDFHRPRKPILAFAGGVHSCMGAHLARLEVKLCITEFLRRIPDFKVKDGAKIEYWPGGVLGPKSLPLTW